jgi:hypothetical protein
MRAVDMPEPSQPGSFLPIGHEVRIGVDGRRAHGSAHGRAEELGGFGGVAGGAGIGGARAHGRR